MASVLKIFSAVKPYECLFGELGRSYCYCTSTVLFIQMVAVTVVFKNSFKVINKVCIESIIF